MKYCVVGYGRSGTHLVSDLLVGLIEGSTHFKVDPWSRAGAGAVLHSNWVETLGTIPDAIAARTRAIVVRRHNLFATAISMVVARHTDEYYDYTNKPVDPIVVDRKQILGIMSSVPDYYRRQVPEARLNERFLTVNTVLFEDLMSTPLLKEHWLSQQLGIEYRDIGRDMRNQNKRDYKSIIQNYRDLKREFDNPSLIEEFWQAKGWNHG